MKIKWVPACLLLAAVISAVQLVRAQNPQQSIMLNALSAPEVLLNASGTNYGQISNTGASQWCLGYGTQTVVNGTCALSWNTSNQATIPVGTSGNTGTLGSRFYTNSTSSSTPASASQITFASVILASNTFTRAGQSVYIVASGSSTAPSYAQTVAITANSAVISSITITPGAASNWTLKAEIYEVSVNTHVVIDSYAVYGASTNVSNIFNTSLIFTDSGQITIAVVGTGGTTSGTLTEYAFYLKKDEQ